MFSSLMFRDIGGPTASALRRRGSFILEAIQ